MNISWTNNRLNVSTDSEAVNVVKDDNFESIIITCERIASGKVTTFSVDANLDSELVEKLMGEHKAYKGNKYSSLSSLAARAYYRFTLGENAEVSNNELATWYETIKAHELNGQKEIAEILAMGHHALSRISMTKQGGISAGYTADTAGLLLALKASADREAEAAEAAKAAEVAAEAAKAAKAAKKTK